MRSVSCTKCGSALDSSNDACPLCGGSPNVVVQLTGQQINSTQGRLGTVTDEPGSDGGRTIRQSTPSGARSISSLGGDRAEIEVRRPIDVGRRLGEDRVLRDLEQRLRHEGYSIRPLPGRDDGKGEDGLLEISGERVVVQIVAIPADPKFWSAVAKESGSWSGSIGEVTELLHAALKKKAEIYTKELRASMLLAIDAIHVAIAAFPEIVGRYLTTHDQPTEEFGFGTIWVVGPTMDTCARLGTGKW